MQSFKQWIFILIALVMIGAAVVVIVVNKDKDGNGGAVISETEIFVGEINELIFEAGACEIEIKEGPVNQATVEYKNIKEKYISGGLSDGVLKIKYAPKNSWNFDFLDFDDWKDDAKIILTLPEDTVFDKVTMEFGAAEIIAEQIRAEVLELEVGAGEMNVDSLYAGSSAKFTVGAGVLYADKVYLTDAELNCGVGEMKLSGEIYGNSVAECGVGEIEIALTTEEDTYQGSLDCGLGEITFGRNSVEGSGKKEYGTSSAENRMDIKCGVGEVDVHFE